MASGSGEKREGAGVDNAPMRLWKLDDGATYWIAAPTIRHALDAYWLAVRDAYGFDAWADPEADSISIDEMSEDAARRVQIRDDDSRVTRSAWDSSRDITEATVLGCSEWP